MPMLIDLDDDRNCYIGNDGEYERYNIDPDVIAEAVELVRCRDCLVHGICRYELGLGADGFCSQGQRGERKE